MQTLSILPIPHSFHQIDYYHYAPISAKLDLDSTPKHEIHHDDEQDSEEQEEFSFACTNPQGILIFADEIFHNGQIRPFFPAFLQSDAVSPLPPSLKKLFVEKRNSFSSELPDGKTTTLEVVEVEASNERCKKSNSTGFSKQLRFRRELKLRSNSDSKDVFVLLNPPAPEPVRSDEAKGKKGGKSKTVPSAHEKLYMKNRMRNESIKRRSFFPYRQHLFGFFANMNGFSRNIHLF